MMDMPGFTPKVPSTCAEYRSINVLKCNNNNHSNNDKHGNNETTRKLPQQEMAKIIIDRTNKDMRYEYR